MVTLKDPIRDEIVRELRLFRKGLGYPSVARFTGLFYLTEILGEGIIEKAFRELTLMYEEYGKDPESNIGAFFYLAGWGIGLDSVDQRRNAYRDQFYTDISTAWRRSERGIAELSTIIRDKDQTHRPWAFVSVFQNKNLFQPVLDFNLRHESWQPPQVFIDGEEIELDFHVHRNTKDPSMYTRRVVLPESPLNMEAGFGEQMAAVRVVWPMPVWPVWSLHSWIADPRILTHMRTFPNRGVEILLQWWSQTPVKEIEGLAADKGIWAQRPKVV